jgi:hypothetical protein
MKKMVKIEFYPTEWEDRTHWLEKSETLIDPETIVQVEGIVTNTIEAKDGYRSYKAVKSAKMAFIRTTISIGRGINGVDFKGFWVTDKTYKKLMGLFEII